MTIYRQPCQSPNSGNRHLPTLPKKLKHISRLWITNLVNADSPMYPHQNIKTHLSIVDYQSIKCRLPYIRLLKQDSISLLVVRSLSPRFVQSAVLMFQCVEHYL
jgi:hypothetical protein